MPVLFFAMVCALLFSMTSAQAHVSEQGLVLLLPTGHYITSGVLSVVASIILISLAPKSIVARLFRPVELPRMPVSPRFAQGLSLLATLVFWLLIYLGVTGPRDPLTNLFTLSVWVGFWIVLFSAIGLSTNLWRVLNPWTGLAQVVFGRDHLGLLPLPKILGAGPALVIFLAFSGFYVADPAPNDPDRLAQMAAFYWLFTLAGLGLFGTQTWMTRGEAFSVLFDLLARAAPFGRGTQARLGLPGWDLVSTRPLPLSLGLFAIAILGVGSFDGLKETFWWLGLIGVNPLEFPGRSFVIGSSLMGLAASTLGLTFVFVSAIWLGARMANPGPVPLRMLVCRFAPTVLPIALAYHISHFLITFLVDGQYLLAAIGDPLANGANLLGLGQIRVTTGFLNTADSVKTIWLTQASVVVIGHILAVLVSHHIALTVFETQRRAALSQIPIACFMIAYTFFGLWLLAAPRGI